MTVKNYFSKDLACALPGNAHRMRMARRKTKAEKAISLNITLSPALVQVLNRIVREHAYSGPVDYFKSRVRLDGGLTLKTDGKETSQSYVG